MMYSNNSCFAEVCRSIITVLFVALILPARAQNPDSIIISMPKKIVNTRDCFVTVRICRRDSSSFVFPKDARFGDLSDLRADLVFVLERKNKSTYGQYVCNIPMGEDMGWEKEPIVYQKVRDIQMDDSLNALHCLNGGRYRLKLKYNLRKPDGAVQLADFIVESNWVYFEVNQKILYLSGPGRKYND